MPEANGNRPAPRAGGALVPGTLVALALAGCLAGPADRGGGPSLSPRSTSNTDADEIPRCVRVWSEARQDSIWNCPDPKPPAPAQGGPG